MNIMQPNETEVTVMRFEIADFAGLFSVLVFSAAAMCWLSTGV